jgi:L-seryl-tRNA(Ser) seleniumtransferase
MTDAVEVRLRGLPRVDRILSHPNLVEERARLGSGMKAIVRAVLDDARAAVLQGASAIDEAEAAERAARRARAWEMRRTQRVVNATGVVLHTNLGRAPLSRRAAQALAATASGYVSLEIDLATGRRGGRAAFAESAIAGLTGAEAALLVNNNAAAVLLALAAVADGRSVLVSRGELIEIGGGFRVPEVLARSGARLVEVGTTNRTRVDDYARALDRHDDVGAILRVHPGNFRQTGFVERPALRDLVALAHARGLRLVEDLGGGALVDHDDVGLRSDPLVREAVAAGADLVTFSTDKILGGPQGGAIVGRAEAVEAARRDPLARALRLGRLPLVALEATLSAYLDGDLDAVPVVAMVRRSAEALRARVEGWLTALDAGAGARAVPVSSVAGGGTYAGDNLPSWALALATDDADALVARLRTGDPPVLARIENGAVLLDARTVLDDEDAALLAAVRAAR